MQESIEKQSWFKRNWKWFVPVLIGGLLLICVGCVAVFGATIFGALKSSEPYQQALTLTQENAEAVAALGSPIEAGFFVSGSVETTGSGGNADLSFPVSGPDGSGTVYVMAVKSGDVWEYSAIELVVNDSSERIDILGKR